MKMNKRFCASFEVRVLFAQRSEIVGWVHQPGRAQRHAVADRA